jgi:hypothetical protein
MSRRLALAASLTLVACSGDLHENIPPGAFDPVPDSDGGVATVAAAPVHFDTDIQTDIDNYGCSTVGCHGSAMGDLKLTAGATGADLTANYDSLKPRASSGEQSKVLIKATGGDGHVGGVRFQKADPIYTRWLNWIKQGNPR